MQQQSRTSQPTLKPQYPQTPYLKNRVTHHALFMSSKSLGSAMKIWTLKILFLSLPARASRLSIIPKTSLVCM